MAQLVEQEQTDQPAHWRTTSPSSGARVERRRAARVAARRRESALRAASSALGFPTTQTRSGGSPASRRSPERTFALADRRAPAPTSAAAAARPAARTPLVFVNGRFAPQLSTLDRLPEGVRCSSLAATLALTPSAGRAVSRPAVAAEQQRVHRAQHRAFCATARCRASARAASSSRSRSKLSCLVSRARRRRCRIPRAADRGRRGHRRRTWSRRYVGPGAATSPTR